MGIAVSALLRGASAIAPTASATRFFGMFIGRVIDNITPESRCAQVVGTAVTLNNYYYTLGQNNRASSGTSFTSRKNSAAGNLTVSFAASTAGTQTDVTHSDSLAVGDTLNDSITAGSGTGTIVFGLVGVNVAAASGSTSFIGTCTTTNTLSGTGPLSDYLNYIGSNNTSTTVVGSAQVYVQNASTAKYFQLNVIATNGRSTTTTASVNVGGSNVNGTVSYASGATGQVTDTTHTDSLAVGNLLAMVVNLGTGTGNFIETQIGATFDNSTNGGFWQGSQNSAGNAATTAGGYVPLNGQLTPAATESDVQGEVGLAAVASGLWINVITNASTTNATLKFRNAAADKNQVVTATALTTGAFQDTTHSDSFTATALVNLSWGNITTGSVTYTAHSMLMTAPVANTQSVSTSTTPVPAIVRSTGKIVSTNTTPIPSIVRSIGKPVNTNTTPVPSIVRSTGKIVSTNTTPVPSVVRSTGKVLSVDTTPVPQILRVNGKIIAILTTPVPSVSTVYTPGTVTTIDGGLPLTKKQAAALRRRLARKRELEEALAKAKLEQNESLVQELRKAIIGEEEEIIEANDDDSEEDELIELLLPNS